MKRLSLVFCIIGVAALPYSAQGQSPATPVVGFIHMQDASSFMHLAEAFRRGLAEQGFAEGRTVRIEYRWAQNQFDRVPSLVSDFIQNNVSLIFATGGGAAPRAAKAATSTIPIIFTTGSDPVESGLVPNLNRPGGNITGVSFLTDAMGSHRLGLLREVMPKGSGVSVLINPKGPDAERQLKEIPAVAASISQPINIITASNEDEVEAAFRIIVERGSKGILVGADPFFNHRRDQIIQLVTRHSFPAVYELREFVAAGGLMSYGASLPDAYRQAGVYAGRVLNGAKPGDLPVLQPTKFELVINLTAAKAIRLTVPPSLLARADEVIE